MPQLLYFPQPRQSTGKRAAGERLRCGVGIQDPPATVMYINMLTIDYRREPISGRAGKMQGWLAYLCGQHVGSTASRIDYPMS